MSKKIVAQRRDCSAISDNVSARVASSAIGREQVVQQSHRATGHRDGPAGRTRIVDDKSAIGDG